MRNPTLPCKTRVWPRGLAAAAETAAAGWARPRRGNGGRSQGGCLRSGEHRGGLAADGRVREVHRLLPPREQPVSRTGDVLVRLVVRERVADVEQSPPQLFCVISQAIGKASFSAGNARTAMFHRDFGSPLNELQVNGIDLPALIEAYQPGTVRRGVSIPAVYATDPRAWPVRFTTIPEHRYAFGKAPLHATTGRDSCLLLIRHKSLGRGCWLDRKY